jgi:hypothetical protein
VLVRLRRDGEITGFDLDRDVQPLQVEAMRTLALKMAVNKR